MKYQNDNQSHIIFLGDAIEILDQEIRDNSIEEIINIPMLHEKITTIFVNNKIQEVINEIIIQSKLEFNINE